MGEAGRYGWEMRSLWRPTRSGWLMVGGDASGLELRMLGHHLSLWDGGAYAREVISGDVHAITNAALGVDDRDLAKRVIYAYLYGAGDDHLDEMIGHKGAGKAFREKLEREIPALARLRTWCAQCASEKGFVPLLDGRHAPIRSVHAALNTLLQGNGIIVMKLAIIICYDALVKLKIMHSKCALMLWPHDELQFEAHPDVAETVGETICNAITRAGVALRVKCPLAGDYKIGKNWAQTH